MSTITRTQESLDSIGEQLIGGTRPLTLLDGAGELQVPDQDLTIRWDNKVCVVECAGEEVVVDEGSGASLQLSRWRSGPQISWLGKETAGRWWFGVQLVVNGEQYRLKAPHESVDAEELPLLELGGAEEVSEERLMAAVTAIRYHGGGLNQGTHQEQPPDDVAEQELWHWSEPVQSAGLIYLGLAIVPLALMADEIGSLLTWLNAGLQLAVFGWIHRIRLRRLYSPKTTQRADIPDVFSEYVPMIAMGPPILFGSVFYPEASVETIPLLLLLAVTAAAFSGTIYHVTMWMRGQVLSDGSAAAGSSEGERESLPSRTTAWDYFKSTLVPLLALIAVGVMFGRQNLPLTFSITGAGLLLFTRHIWTSVQMVRSGGWPDWRGPSISSQSSDDEGSIHLKSLMTALLLGLPAAIGFDMGREISLLLGLGVGVPLLLVAYWLYCELHLRKLRAQQ